MKHAPGNHHDHYCPECGTELESGGRCPECSTKGSSATVFLIDPKYPHNVGGAYRAVCELGADRLGWSGERVDSYTNPSERLPREERLPRYRETAGMVHIPGGRGVLKAFSELTPVAVERRDAAEPLPTFLHPEGALYMFGPEDGGLPGWALEACHRFVTIPTTAGPLNLAAAVNVVLYDRKAKLAADVSQRLLGFALENA